MFPFVRDIHSYLEGYDITNMYYTGLTTIATAFKDAASLLGGDTENTARNMRRTLIGVSQVFGVPLRNLETYSKGVIGLFSPSARYKYESVFYNQPYVKDLQKAVDKGDDKMADTITEMMLKDKGIGKTDAKTRMEIIKLYAQGENVLPSGVGKSITINGEERELTKAERRQISSIYSQADITKLTNSPEYAKLTTAQKAKAIRTLYSIQREKAYAKVLGLELPKRALFAYAIDPAIIAYVLAMVSDMQGDKKLIIQRIINQLNVPASQKYMLMGMLGYRNKNGAGIVRAYINRLDLTRTEKQSLYEHSGY
ncbi:MAG TPA: hypothetical protein GX745_05975 [Clostridiales bacterium]|nr:hypothetical protein [Clostridiales bacterium]